MYVYLYIYVYTRNIPQRTFFSNFNHLDSKGLYSNKVEIQILKTTLNLSFHIRVKFI